MPKKYRKWKKFKWGLIDWHKNDVVIAEETGCDPALVGRYRKKYSRLKTPRTHRDSIQWEKVDWRWSNEMIAAATGATKNRVQFKRTEDFKRRMAALEVHSLEGLLRLAERLQGLEP